MKKELHPKYAETVIKCACGNEIKTRSTVPGEMHVELCSACHPYYTGKQKFVDTAGRVDKFRARVEAASKKTTQVKDEVSKEKTNGKSNAEKLAEIKKDIAVKPDFEVTQEQTSDVEIAAGEELKDAANDKTEDKETKQ